MTCCSLQQQDNVRSMWVDITMYTSHKVVSRRHVPLNVHWVVSAVQLLEETFLKPVLHLLWSITTQGNIPLQQVPAVTVSCAYSSFDVVPATYCMPHTHPCTYPPPSQHAKKGMCLWIGDFPAWLVDSVWVGEVSLENVWGNSNYMTEFWVGGSRENDFSATCTS